MTGDDFKAWKRRNRLTNLSVAAVLGKSTRYYSDLSSGSTKIPLYLCAAFWAYDQGWRPENQDNPRKKVATNELSELQDAITAIMPKARA